MNKSLSKRDFLKYFSWGIKKRYQCNVLYHSFIVISRVLYNFIRKKNLKLSLFCTSFFNPTVVKWLTEFSPKLLDQFPQFFFHYFFLLVLSNKIEKYSCIRFVCVPVCLSVCASFNSRKYFSNVLKFIYVINI